MARPSTFGSVTNRISASAIPCLVSSRSERSSQARSSSSLRALANESIGSRCGAGANRASALPPTLWVGESGVRRSGLAASSSRSSEIRASYSESETSGSSST